MRRAAAAGRILALALTALALLATSVARRCDAGAGLFGAPVGFAVAGACGPAGVVTLRADPESCSVTLTGGEAVELTGGQLYWAPPRKELSLGHPVAGGIDRCWGTEAGPGHWRLRCYHDVAGGCGGDDTVPYCDLTLDQEGAP